MVHRTQRPRVRGRPQAHLQLLIELVDRYREIAQVCDLKSLSLSAGDCEANVAPAGTGLRRLGDRARRFNLKSNGASKRKDMFDLPLPESVGSLCPFLCPHCLKMSRNPSYCGSALGQLRPNKPPAKPLEKSNVSHSIVVQRNGAPDAGKPEFWGC